MLSAAHGASHPGRCRVIGPGAEEARKSKNIEINYSKTTTTATTVNWYSTFTRPLTTVTAKINHFKTKFFNTPTNSTIMAQSNSNTIWTAPSFSFDTADQPTAWRDFYTQSNRLFRNIIHKPRRGRSTKKGMGTNHNDVYRGKQTDTSNLNRQ